MRMPRLMFFVTLLSLLLSIPVKADIILLNSSSFVNPEENLILDGTSGNQALGHTNETSALFRIAADEAITGGSGQAWIEAVEGNFSSAVIDAEDPLLYFTEFEANLKVAGQPDIIVTAFGYDGEVVSLTFQGGNGQNFFGVKATDGSLIDSITISTANKIEEIGHIRVGGVNGMRAMGDSTPVPEPASLLLLGTGLGVIGLAVWRRK